MPSPAVCSSSRSAASTGPPRSGPGRAWGYSSGRRPRGRSGSSRRAFDLDGRVAERDHRDFRLGRPCPAASAGQETPGPGLRPSARRGRAASVPSASRYFTSCTWHSISSVCESGRPMRIFDRHCGLRFVNEVTARPLGSMIEATHCVLLLLLRALHALGFDLQHRGQQDHRLFVGLQGLARRVTIWRSSVWARSVPAANTRHTHA